MFLKEGGCFFSAETICYWAVKNVETGHFILYLYFSFFLFSACGNNWLGGVSPKKIVNFSGEELHLTVSNHYSLSSDSQLTPFF